MGQRQWAGAGKVKQMRAPMPLVEIANDRRVLIEHHQGVSSYTAEQVLVRVRYGQICVSGTGLCIARMTRDQLVICGNIDGVTLIRAGGKHEG